MTNWTSKKVFVDVRQNRKTPHCLVASSNNHFWSSSQPYLELCSDNFSMHSPIIPFSLFNPLTTDHHPRTIHHLLTIWPWNVSFFAFETNVLWTFFPQLYSYDVILCKGMGGWSYVLTWCQNMRTWGLIGDACSWTTCYARIEARSINSCASQTKNQKGPKTKRVQLI